MDERAQAQSWYASRMISKSPPPQPARLIPGVLGDRSLTQGTKGRQKSNTRAQPQSRMHPRHPQDSRAQHAPPSAQHGQHPETSRQTSGAKRRSRSSSFDEREYRQVCEGEARGGDHQPPPTRRRRVASETENVTMNRRARTKSSSQAETINRRQRSKSLSPQGCRTPREAPARRGRDADDSPPERGRNRDDVLMRSASPPCLPQADERGSGGRGNVSDRRDYSPSKPRDWNANQSQGPASTTHNIENTGNVFSGINIGNVYMQSVIGRSADDFMINLADRLKICVRADHMYYAPNEEIALHRGECTPGTRIDVLQGVTRWAINASPHSERVYWLSGQAGAGKTTIAYTIARYFENLVNDRNGKAILGGSFFCSRQFLDTRSVSSIVRTIVYQLAVRSKPFQMALKEYGRFETVDHGPRSQLMGLLIVPWERSAPGRLADNEPCYVIPIDALDELEGAGGTEFLSTLFEVVDKQDLSGLKFFITSRSDPALVNRITSFPNKQLCRLEEVPLEASSADIKLYLDENLTECATTQQIQKLVSDAAGLFIYAATVVEYVKGRDVVEQKSLLEQLLSPSSSSTRRTSRAVTAALDHLYLQILETSLVDPRERDDPGVFQDCLSILHIFLCTVERTSTSVAVNIFNATFGDGATVLNTGTAEGVLHRLHAVLYIQDGRVMWYHKSFADFLLDECRSERFFCNQEQHHHRLANACFRIMENQLRFNIANITSSYQMDRDDPSLSSRIDANIAAPLRYACGHWSAHLILTHLEALESLTLAVHEFLQLRVLFWIESMNLLGQRGRCHGMLRDAQRWLSRSKGAMELVSELADGAAFAAYHSASKAALSTPHLYLSSLATFSRHSATVQNWKQQITGIPEFTSAQGAGGEALMACITLGDEVTALAVSPDGFSVAVGLPGGFVQISDLSTGEEMRVLEGLSGMVMAVSYSPDGTHVVSGSEDKSARVWSLTTGEEVRVLEGHTGTVLAVAYSPDGTHVVTGSSDRSIRAWNLSTGEVRAFKGHKDRVRSVAYSPHGDLVVSGSDDKSLRVWDVSSGQKRVLKGHTSGVTAVAYSPHGTHVVSGSTDQSVRVWDLSTGEVKRVLKGHTGWVRAVAYSPDGTHVVAGSNDRSVRVWNLSTGQEKRIFEGHTSGVIAVVYLPDGSHVVSGSNDQSVRVWDLSTGDERRVLEGHTDLVLAVAYSPDGTRVVSSSGDNSVRVWDLPAEEEARVFEGHNNWVNAVASSSDGTHIVSGSNDKLLRLWDFHTGEEVMSLAGHTDRVNAVAFSPDGTQIVSASDDGSLRVWDLSTGEEKRLLEGYTDRVLAVAYSPDGKRVVSGFSDNLVRVWDVSTREEVRSLEGHTSTVWAVAYSPDGTHVVSGSYDKSVRVWDVPTGEEVRVFKGHTNWVNAVAYLPNGTHVVSGSYDKSIRVWDLSTGEQVGVLMGHTDSVWAVARSPDGIHIASGSGDNSVRVWNVSPEYTPRYIRQQAPDGDYTGWLLSPTDPSAYLMFVRPEALLPDDSNILTFPASAVPHLDISNAKFGDRWLECYTPRSL